MPETNKQSMGEIIKAWRKKRKFTQESFAEKCGISKRYLVSIEKGNVNPSYDVLYAIIRALDISADELFYSDLPESDKRTKMLLIQFQNCSDENQEVVLRTMECMIHCLLERQ